MGMNQAQWETARKDAITLWYADGSPATLEGSAMIVHHDGTPMRGELGDLALTEARDARGWWVNGGSTVRHRPTCTHVRWSMMKEVRPPTYSGYRAGQCCAPGLTDHQPGQPSEE